MIGQTGKQQAQIDQLGARFYRTKKRYLMLLLLLGYVGVSYSQVSFANAKGSIGFTYSGFGDNDAFYFESLDGAGGYIGKGHHSLGVTYIYPFRKNIDLEVALSYGRYKYRFSNASLGPDAPEPFIVTNAVIDIPLTVRWSFLNYLFLNGGLLIGINAANDSDVESQSGIGALLGVGAKYDMKNIPIGFFINPYYKFQNLLSFSTDSYRLRTDDTGFRVGLVYNF